jgi:membrane protease YdiL (CAAX protease family)
MSDPDARVRRAAAEGLGAMGTLGPEALLELVADADPDPGVRAAARASYDRVWPLRKSPRVAAGLSLVCPGCGHFYLRQPGKAAALLGSAAATLGGGLALALPSLEQSNEAGPLPRFKDARGPIGLQLLMAAQNIWLYGIFAAYRDARALRADAGYRYPMSRESLTDLVSAPVRPRVLARPWFWAGLPILLGGALALGSLIDDGLITSDRRRLFDCGGGVRFLGRCFGKPAGYALGEAYYAALFLPVGVGEEAVFRGALQPGLSEWFGPWGGWATTSLLFGAAHIGNFASGRPGEARAALVALPFITVTGSYLGLVSMKTGAQLETSVALHFWYDFLLSTAAFISDPDDQPFAVRIGMPF